MIVLILNLTDPANVHTFKSVIKFLTFYHADLVGISEMI